MHSNTIIIGAMRTYFKTKKTELRERGPISRGKPLRGREGGVGISLTLSAETKTKLDPLMKADYMSSDESI